MVLVQTVGDYRQIVTINGVTIDNGSLYTVNLVNLKSMDYLTLAIEQNNHTHY